MSDLAKTSVFISCDDATYAAALSVGLPANAEVAVVGVASGPPDDDDDSVRDEADVVIVTTDVPAWEDVVQTDSIDRAVLVVDGALDPKVMITAVESGALGYIDRSVSFKDFGAAVLSVAAGTPVIPPEMLGALLRRSVDRRREQRREIERLDALTNRERQVFEGLARGLDKDDIAAELFISPQTVRTHKQKLFRKLGLHSSAEVVAMAARCGLDIGRAT